MTEPAAPEPVPEERITNALHKVQDDLQQTMSLNRGGRRKRKLSEPHQGGKAMLLTRPWRQPLKRANGKKRQSDYTNKDATKPRKPRPYTTKPSCAHSPKRSRSM